MLPASDFPLQDCHRTDRLVLICQREQSGLPGRRKGVCVCTHNPSVHFGQLITQFFVGNCDDDGGLLSHSGRGVGACLDDSVNGFFWAHVRLVFADASSGCYVVHYFGHFEVPPDFYDIEVIITLFVHFLNYLF